MECLELELKSKMRLRLKLSLKLKLKLELELTLRLKSKQIKIETLKLEVWYWVCSEENGLFIKESISYKSVLCLYCGNCIVYVCIVLCVLRKARCMCVKSVVYPMRSVFWLHWGVCVACGWKKSVIYMYWQECVVFLLRKCVYIERECVVYDQFLWFCIYLSLPVSWYIAFLISILISVSILYIYINIYMSI